MAVGENSQSGIKEDAQRPTTKFSEVIGAENAKTELAWFTEFLKNPKKYSMEGAALPDVMLEDVDGQMHKLADFRGKYLYIDLWASWCGPCCQEVPYLQKLEKQLNNPMVEFISISLDTNKKAWKEKMKQLNMHGHQYIVTGDQFATMMNIKGIPHFLLYSKAGTLMQYKAEHPSSGDRIRNVLVRLK